MKRPTIGGPESPHSTIVTTPRAAMMMQLLGSGLVRGGVALSRDEYAAINKLYGFTKEQPNPKPPPPKAPERETFKTSWDFEAAVKKYQEAVKAWQNWQDPRPLMQAGADHNVARTAEVDGLRLVAFLAKFVPAGEDPLKHLIQAASDAGWDVDPSDLEWAEAVEEDVEDPETDLIESTG